MAAAGIDAHNLDPFADRGDGVLALIHPTDEVPKTWLVRSLIPELTRHLNAPPGWVILQVVGVLRVNVRR